jgi:hypothetical protein
MELTNEVAVEVANSASGSASGKDAGVCFVTDSLGRRHRYDSRGRFAKQDGSRASKVSSALTYGKHLLPHVDGRSLPYQRYRAIVTAIAVDQGGVEELSATRAQLIRRFAAASVLAEQLEVRIARGEQIDIQVHATLSSTLVRLASRIGIDRMPRDITPDPLTYAREREPA